MIKNNIKEMTKDEKYEKYLETMIWYHKEKKTPTGFFSTVGRIDQKLGDLIDTLKKADESSTELTKALNTLTKWGVIVATGGVVVALLSLSFEIYKYIN